MHRYDILINLHIHTKTPQVRVFQSYSRSLILRPHGIPQTELELTEQVEIRWLKSIWFVAERSINHPKCLKKYYSRRLGPTDRRFELCQFLLCKDYKKDIFGRFAYDFELSQNILSFLIYVHSYLTTYLNSIPEKEIVITSCLGQSFIRYANKKIIHVPNVHKRYCDIRDGRAYGFDFKISDAELDFYNANGDIMQRIEKAYMRL